MKTLLSLDARPSNRQTCALNDLDYVLLRQLERGAAPETTKACENTAWTQQQLANRIRYFEKSNIAQTLALTNIAASGQDLAHYFIRVKNRPVGEVAADVAGLRATVVVASLRNGYHLMATARISKEYSAYQVLEELSVIPGVSTVEIELVLRQIVNHISHVRLAGEPVVEFADERKARLKTDLGEGVMNELDLGIVAHLQRSGWTSNRMIAEKLKLTEGAIRYRIKKLKERNLLKFVTTFDPKILGLRHWSWLKLEVQPEKLDDVIAALKNCRWTKYLAVTTGAKSLACLALTKSKKELAAIIDNEVRTLTGIHDICVSQVIANHKLDKRWGSF